MGCASFLYFIFSNEPCRLCFPRLLFVIMLAMLLHICVFDFLLAVLQLTPRISASPVVQHGTTDMACAMHPLATLSPLLCWAFSTWIPMLNDLTSCWKLKFDDVKVHLISTPCDHCTEDICSTRIGRYHLRRLRCLGGHFSLPQKSSSDLTTAAVPLECCAT